MNRDSRTRTGAVATSTLLAIALVLGIAGGGVLFLDKSITLLQLVFSNLFYLGMFALLFIFAIILMRLVQQERISWQQATIGGALLFLVFLAVPALGVNIGEMTTSWTVTVQAKTSQTTIGQLGQVNYNGLQVVQVEQTGPSIIRQEQPACVVGCEDFTVEVTAYCNGEEQKTITLTGQGGDNPTGKISGLPDDTQCYLEGSMTRPADHGGIQGTDTVYFTTR